MSCSPVEIIGFDMDTLSHSCHNLVTVAYRSACPFTSSKIPCYRLSY
jgi:hypothetical protein